MTSTRHLVPALLVTLLAGCGSEATVEEPEGAYLAYRDALLSGHPEQLWEWLDADTKQLYADAVSDLASLAESVSQLSPADRTIAYERTAVRLADVVETGEDLFVQIIRLENLPGDDRYALGSEIEDLDWAGEGTEHATIHTRAGQTVQLVREEDGVWRVSSLATLASQQLRPIAESVSAVDVLAAESAYMRRSHAEIVRLLGGSPEAPEHGSGEGTGQP